MLLFALCGAGLLVLYYYRIGALGTFWCDEVHTIIRAQYPAIEIVRNSVSDAHPPGFFLLFRAWQKLLGVLGVAPCPQSARLVNLVPLFLLFSVAWVTGTRLLGRVPGVVAALCLATNTQVMNLMGEARHYGIVICGFFFCWLVLLRAYDAAGVERKRHAVAWACYFLMASFLLWTQLLSGIILGLMGILWIVLIFMKKEGRRDFVIGGMAAQAGALVLFAPWLAHIGGSVDYIREFNWKWLMKADIGNLILTFNWWIMYGRMDPSWPEVWWRLPLGFATWALPLAFLPAGVFAPRERKVDGRVLLMGASGLGLSIAYVLTLWTLARVGWAPVFDGRRYAVVCIALYVFGLAATTKWSLDRLALSGKWLVLLFLPWIGTVWIGMSNMLSPDRHDSIQETAAYLENSLQGYEDAIYCTPSSLIPYHQYLFKRLTLKPIEELANLPEDVDHAAVVQFSWWYMYLDPVSWTYISACRENVFSNECKEYYLPEGGPERRFTLEYLTGIKHDGLHKIGTEDPKRLAGSIPREAVAVAAPMWQAYWDGWHFRELGEKGEPQRRGEKARTVAQFDAPVEPGEYLLRFVGYHHPYPEPEEEFRFQFEGEAQAFERKLPNTEFDVSIPVRIEKPHKVLRLGIERAVWRPIDHIEGNGDVRPHTFTYSRLYLVPWVGKSGS